MPLERRNEPQMLRQFSKMYPSYNLNPLLRRRHQQLVEAQAFNQWLSDRRLRQEGETYADELGRMTEAVNRRIPQLRYAPAERAGVHRMARDVAAGRNTSDSQVDETLHPLHVQILPCAVNVFCLRHFAGNVFVGHT